MNKIIYNDQVVEVGSINEVIELIKKLSDEKTVDNQMVVIETGDLGVLEIGLGMGEESLLFFIPESKEEDMKISCNKYVDRATSEDIEVGHPLGEKFICSKSNLVTLEEAFEVLKIFLSKGDIFTKVDWYAY